MGGLKKALKDSNMAVNAAAIRALGLLGRGLRKSFSMHMPVLIPAFLGNLGNKNRWDISPRTIITVCFVRGVWDQCRGLLVTYQPSYTNPRMFCMWSV